MKKKQVLYSLLYSLLVFIVIYSVYYFFIKSDIFSTLNPYKKLVKTYEEKKYIKTIDLAKEILKDHPKSVNIRRYLWKSYLVTEKYTKALSTLEDLQKLLPKDNIEILYAFCTLYKFMKSYDIAISYCNKAIIIKPENEDLKYEVAKILIEKNDLLKATKYIKNNFNSDSFNRNLLLANIRTIKKEFNKSIKILEELRLKNPNEYKLYYYLANNYIHLNDYIRAATYLEEFISSYNPKSIDSNILEDAYIKLANAYETNKMYAKAYDAYKDASCFSLKIQKTDNAIKMINKAISISYLNYRGFVSQKDFKDKFNLLKKELENRCGSSLFSFKTLIGE